MSNSTTDYAAWWGAIIATLVLAWDVLKWLRSGPRLAISATPDMEEFSRGVGKTSKEPAVFVVVNNVGDRSTTITNLHASHYKNSLARLLKRPDKQFVFPDTTRWGQGIPHEIGPGQRWTGGLLQPQLLEDGCDKGQWFVGVYHSSSKRPASTRLRFRKT